jgi:hypothetical protein
MAAYKHAVGRYVDMRVFSGRQGVGLGWAGDLEASSVWM